MQEDNSRYVSRLTKDTFALILAGGRGSRLHELTDWRAKPALHFGGKVRIIDFPLSNCINSGIRRVGVLTQYKAHSLIRHLVRGWGHFKKELGEHIEILPASQRNSPNWYQGTADALYQNLDIIRSEKSKYVMVLSGDHIYKMDYGTMLAHHVDSGADMTVSCIEVPVEEAAGAFGVMTVGEKDRILAFTEKPSNPAGLPDKPGMALASMGNYIFDTEFLIDILTSDSQQAQSSHDFGNDIIPSVIDEHHVVAHRFSDAQEGNSAYWRDVGTLDSYWLANMELVLPTPPLNMYDSNWPIWTYQTQLPPAKFVFDEPDRRGYATDSVVSSGCIISGGAVKKSVLFSGARVHSHSFVEESILMPDVEVGRGCKIRRAILDREVSVPEGMQIGYDHEEDKARGFRITDNGVVLVTRAMLGQGIGYCVV